MSNIRLLAILLLFSAQVQAQTVKDDFEGNGNIDTWHGDDCGMDNAFPNPFKVGINESDVVLRYADVGGQYANVRFETDEKFDLSTFRTFTLKVYVPSNSITGNQNNQISLKLQDGTIAEPWSTQSEVIKPLMVNQWQTVTFNFGSDPYINLDGNSAPPVERTDFDRVVIQVNGENNNDEVVAYFDDFIYETTPLGTEFNKLVWSDEFNGNGALDATNWYHQTKLPAGGSWFNGEIQHYTNRTTNSNMSGGSLNLVAKKESFADQGQTKQYTSARLNSKFAFTYGRVEVRAKLPSGVGTWPAIWMLGKNINEDGAYWENQGHGTTGWPACGEIDIMEHWGDNQNYVQSAMHTPSSFGGTVNHGGQTIPTASSEFHIYTLEWTEEKMVFAVDGVEHYTYDPSVKNSDTWPFDAEQYILLNIAIQPSIHQAFIQSTMEIDYVRVYHRSPLCSYEIVNQEVYDLKNSPNPANDNTTISYFLPKASDVSLSIYDINGKLVQSLIRKKQTSGQQRVDWDTSNLTSGLYFYTLKTEQNIITKKCIVGW